MAAQLWCRLLIRRGGKAVVRGWRVVAVGLCLWASRPAPAVGQELAVPSTAAEWRALRLQLEQSPFLLAAAGPEKAVPILVAALRTQPDGLSWAAYGPGVCAIEGSDRLRLVGAARVRAYRGSRKCLETVLAALPGADHGPRVNVVRNMLLQPLAESMIESGDLAAADSVASAALEGLDSLDARARGNPEYYMNETRGRVALRRGDRAGAVAFLERAGQTEGSPQLSSFGPRFVLARELLEAGERAPVLDFLDAVAGFWRGADAEASLAAAREAIEAGRIPDGPRWR